MPTDNRAVLAQTHLAYEKASKIDKQINDLIEEYPLSEGKYEQFWTIFCRTVRTGLDLISREVIEPQSTRDRMKMLEEEILTLRKVLRTKQ